MRIGLDAKWLFRGPVSTRTILENLLPQLFELYPAEDWIIFLDKEDKALGIPFHQKNITVQYIWAENNMLSNVFVLPQYLQRLDVDIIIYQTFPSFKKKYASIAFIHDVLFHEHPNYFTWKEKLYFKPLSFFSKKATRLIATSETVASDLVKYNYAKNRDHIDLLPLGVSKLYQPLQAHDPVKVKKVKGMYSLPGQFILYVGRLNTRKNIENLIKSIPYLDNKDIPVVIVGKEDWKAPNLKLLVENDKTKNRIIFTGNIATEDLIIVYSLATIFCFPSFAEGFGLPPLEAMASGVPVIVSASSALPEVCGDAVTYIDPHNPLSIAIAINSLLHDTLKYEQMKKAGIERATLFSWEKTAIKFMQSIINATQSNFK